MKNEKRPRITITNPEEGKVTEIEIMPFSLDVSKINDALIDDIIRACNDNSVQVVVTKTEEKTFVPKDIPSDEQSRGYVATAQAMESRKSDEDRGVDIEELLERVTGSAPKSEYKHDPAYALMAIMKAKGERKAS